MPDPSELRIGGHTLLTGVGEGEVLRLTEPLNAWGGLDPSTGTIVHHSHPERGISVAGRVLVMHETRGSGTNAQIFAQAWAEGNGPVAVVLDSSDFVLCVGAVVGRELYAAQCPVVVVKDVDYDRLSTGQRVVVDAGVDDATVRIR